MVIEDKADLEEKESEEVDPRSKEVLVFLENFKLELSLILPEISG